MSRYHLHARLFEGQLCDPTRNELQSSESDDREHVMALAEELAARGFAVWVYAHDHGGGGINGHRAPYRVIAEWSANGSRRH